MRASCPTAESRLRNPQERSWLRSIPRHLGAYGLLTTGARGSLLAPKDLASGPFFGASRPGSKVSQGAQDAFRFQSEQAGLKNALECIEAISETEFTEDLKTLDLPTLIVADNRLSGPPGETRGTPTNGAFLKAPKRAFGRGTSPTSRHLGGSGANPARRARCKRSVPRVIPEGVACAARVAAVGSEARVQLHLWDEDELARGLAGLEVAVGLGCIRERVGATDADLEGVVARPGEDAPRAPQELLAGRGVPG